MSDDWKRLSASVGCVDLHAPCFHGSEMFCLSLHARWKNLLVSSNALISQCIEFIAQCTHGHGAFCLCMHARFLVALGWCRWILIMDPLRLLVGSHEIFRLIFLSDDGGIHLCHLLHSISGLLRWWLSSYRPHPLPRVRIGIGGDLVVRFLRVIKFEQGSVPGLILLPLMFTLGLRVRGNF